MKNIEQKIIRFYADKPEHVRAFDILKRVAADKDSSIQEFVIAAINHYGDMKSNEDAQAETEENMQQPLMGSGADRNREIEKETLMEQVADVVGAVIEEKLPLLLYSYLSTMGAGQKVDVGVITAGNVAGVSETDFVSLNTTDINESVANADTEAKSLIEKDVVANDMLDLDSFFS